MKYSKRREKKCCKLLQKLIWNKKKCAWVNMISALSDVRAMEQLNREWLFTVSCNMKIWRLLNAIISQQS